ncbi:MAG TPA: tRNA (adenosine(37)-N6)-dimethylallyltransferase MiaA [Terriglobales bacterium]
MADPLLVAIVGPTGSGKTSLSLALAERCGGEIVNCDSVAVYREFYIGTAKPSPEERARAPHHLLDIVDPEGVITAGDYARRGREVLNDIKRRERLPIVVGGTGLYLRALLEGLFAGPERSEELRERLRRREKEKGVAHLHRLLRKLDPEAAARIHENDTPKVIRALEVCISSRAPMSELWKQGRDALAGFRVVRVGLNPERNALYTRINERCRRMFDAGLVEETRALMEKYPKAWALSSLGYKQAAQYLRGEIDLKLALWAAQQSHRNYAKRQLTWFRREPEVKWLAGFGDDVEVQQKAIAAMSEIA